MIKYGLLSLSLVLAANTAVAEVSIEFHNSSDWDIHHLYVSSVGENEWGPDQLGDGKDDVIEAGSTFTLTHVEEGKYDFKLVDDEGDECVVGGQSVKSSGSVTITSENLAGCEKHTADTTEE